MLQHYNINIINIFFFYINAIFIYNERQRLPNSREPERLEVYNVEEEIIKAYKKAKSGTCILSLGGTTREPITFIIKYCFRK